MTGVRTPHYQQRLGECGLVCAQVLATSAGVALDEDEVRELRAIAQRRGELTLADIHRVLQRAGAAPEPLSIHDWPAYLRAGTGRRSAHLALAEGRHFVVVTPDARGVRMDDPGRGRVRLAPQTCAALLGPAVLRVRPVRASLAAAVTAQFPDCDLGAAVTACAGRIRSAGLADPVDRVIAVRAVRAAAGALVAIAFAPSSVPQQPGGRAGLLAVTAALSIAHSRGQQHRRMLRYQQRVAAATGPRSPEHLILRDLHRDRATAISAAVALCSAAALHRSPERLIFAAAIASAFADVTSTLDNLERSRVTIAYRKELP